MVRQLSRRAVQAGTSRPPRSDGSGARPGRGPAGRRGIAAVAALVTAVLVATAWIKLRAQPMARLHIACVPGQAHGFALDYTSHGELVDGTFGLPGLSGPEAQLIDVTLRGQVTETCVENTADKQVFSLEFSELTGEAIAGGRLPAGELLAGTSFVELTPDGIVQTIRFAEAMSSLGQNIVRDLMSHRSMKLHPGAATQWRSEEVAIDGPYTAEYRIERVIGDSTELRKRRRSPSAAIAGAPQRPRARYLDATQAAIRIAHAWLADLDSTTDLSVVSGPKVIGTSRTHVVLHGGPATPRPIERLGALLTAMRASRAVVGDLAASDVDQRLDDKIQRDELGGETWTTLWAKATSTEPDAPKLFLQMRALFKLDPARCKDAAAALAGLASVKDNAFTITASALTAAGTPQAQAALRDAITACAAKRDHQEVLLAELGNLANPDRASEAFTRDIVAHHGDGEIRNVAQLALGNMARALVDSEPDRGEALVGEALQQIQGARTLDDRMVSILTLGNTGSRRSWDALRAAASDPDFRVRQVAASALRAVEGDDVEQLLLALAVRDPEPSVRAEAATSLQQRSVAPATFEALSQLVRRDPSEAVRQTLVVVIAGYAEPFPAALGVLEWVAQHDPKQDVRHNAELTLLRLRPKAS